MKQKRRRYKWGTDKEVVSRMKEYARNQINKEWLKKHGYPQDMHGVYMAFIREKSITAKHSPVMIKKEIESWLQGIPDAINFEFCTWNAALVVGKQWLLEDDAVVKGIYESEPSYYYDFYKEAMALMIYYWQVF